MVLKIIILHEQLIALISKTTLVHFKLKNI